MVITSIDNANIQLVKKLSDKKYRKETGLFVVEGERLVFDAIKHGAVVNRVLLRESSADKFDVENALIVADKVFDKLADTVSSQGILAVVEKPSELWQKPKGNVVILDGVQDPGNVGTIIRTAVSCGFTDIYFVNNCVDAYSSKVLRSAVSAHFCINLHVGTVKEVKQSVTNCKIVVADMDGENLFDTKIDSQIALVLGNEANGVSDCWQGEKVVSLPMKNDFESLNVAVAGSVIMYYVSFGCK